MKIKKYYRYGLLALLVVSLVFPILRIKFMLGQPQDPNYLHLFWNDIVMWIEVCCSILLAGVVSYLLLLTYQRDY